jgi:hypothetical protein
MRPRILLSLLIALLVPQLAYAGSACCQFCPDQYQQEGQFPYFEVIRTRRLIPDTNLITAEGWKRVFESCPQMDRVNIGATTEVTVAARAFLQLTDQTTPDIDIEYRWLLDDVVAGATFRFRTGYAGFPEGDDINIVLPQVPAGRHRLAIEGRLIGEGSADLRLLFVTAQGFPFARFPGDSLIDPNRRPIGSDWTSTGPTLDVAPSEPAHLYFQSYVEGTPGDAIDFRYVVDDVPLAPFTAMIPPAGGVALWDHTGGTVAMGDHTIRLEARAAVSSILTLVQVEAASAPAVLEGMTLSSLDASSDGSFGTEHQPLNCLILSEGATGGTGGLGGTPACGKYDLLLDTRLPAAPRTIFGALDDYTIFGDGYVEIDNRSDAAGIVTLTIEAIYEDGRVSNCNALIDTPNASCPAANTCATADFTLVEFAVPPGRSQKFFYVDPIRWGSFAPNRIRIWARSGNCFGVAPLDLSFGRTRLGMQIVPAGPGACFSARAFGRGPAPSITASVAGAKVLLQMQTATPSFGYGFIDILRGEGNGPLTLLIRLLDTSRSYVDTTARPGVAYRYQAHVVENTSDAQLPYPSVCGFPSEEVRASIPARRRAVQH